MSRRLDLRPKDRPPVKPVIDHSYPGGEEQRAKDAAHLRENPPFCIAWARRP